MTAYFDALRDAMSLCHAAGAVFMGQSVLAGGTAMHRTLTHIPENDRIELPVFEDTQLGMATGISLAGGLVVTCYPRWNFLLLAANQLVNHLDKLSLYSDYRPKILIRVAVPTNQPLDPGHQHMGDFTTAFRHMLETVTVRLLDDPEQVVLAYQRALDREGSTLLVEYSEKY